mgnify:CR=1 FL=1
MDRNRVGQFEKGHRSFKKPPSECVVDGCQTVSKCRKYCGLHYQRWKNYGNPTEPKHWLGAPKNGSTFECTTCKKSFYRSKSQIDRGRQRFCSKPCSALMWKGVKRGSKPLEGRWRKGRKGYIASTIGRKRIWQHRYVMEKAIGRPLDRHEIIHHINGIKHDNRLENLHITNNKEHKLGYGHAFIDGYKAGYKDCLNKKEMAHK